MPARRDILKSGVALGAAIVAAGPTGVGAVAAGRARYVVDMTLPEAPQLARRIGKAGHDLHDPQREIVALLLSPQWDNRGGPIIGLTTWSDFALARDLLRTSARPIRHAVVLEGSRPAVVIGARRGPAHRALMDLLGPASRHPAQRATSFLWLA